PGGFAEYAVTDWGRVHRIPANNMTYEQATCFPVALQTMHNAAITAGRFKRGETLLMQGASSGVGLMGMQIGKLMGASQVIDTSTNVQRRARLKEFSCDLALDSGDPKWPEQVKEGTGGKGGSISSSTWYRAASPRTSTPRYSLAGSLMSGGSAALSDAAGSDVYAGRHITSFSGATYGKRQRL